MRVWEKIGERVREGERRAWMECTRTQRDQIREHSLGDLLREGEGRKGKKGLRKTCEQDFQRIRGETV